MDRAALLEFLDGVGARSLEGYLSQYATDPFAALDERLQWAAWHFRDDTHREEARFLMEHHGAVREVLEEGETAWHLRLRREENAAKRAASATPAPPRQAHRPPPPVPAALRSLAGIAEPTLGGRAPTPVSAPSPFSPPPPPAPSGASHTPHPGIESNTPITRKPGSPSSEAPTVIRDDPNEHAARTPTKIPMPSMMPTGLDRTIADLDDDDPIAGETPLRLGLEKTGIVGDDDDDTTPHRRLPDSLPGPAFIGTPMGAPLRGRTQTDQTAMVLAVGLALAGFGALALAAALVISSVVKEPAPTPAPPPPSAAEAP